jgi:RIO kinase 1
MNLTYYEDYEEFSHFFALDRRAHRQQKVLRQPRPRQTNGAAIPGWILEQIEGEDEFATSYAPGEGEQILLQEALTDFYRDNVITDVLARVKGGKEANVYCCAAHPATGVELIAAKIYRPESHRTMRNDAIYKEGRMMLDTEGKEIVRGARIKRAIAKKTDFGHEVITFSWIEHEYDMLQALYAAGADVPRPIAHVGNTILMEYLGELNQPAPTLNSVTLTDAEAQPLFDRLLWHVEIMLAGNRVHGDLSAYNVLYWQGKGTVIDFPQAVVALRNPHARQLLQRDIERLSQYFARYGVEADAAALADDLWRRFTNAEL